MSIVSIRLPDDVERRLALEAERTHRGKSEIARDAIIDYLERQERERFISQLVRAARARGDEEALSLAEEALPLDNEALEASENSGFSLWRTYLSEKEDRAACSRTVLL